MLTGGFVAAVGGGVLSTLWSLATGADVLASTLAVGTMVLPVASPHWALVAAAAVVHLTLSVAFAAPVVAMLPPVCAIPVAMLTAVAIGLVNLRVVAPGGFPQSTSTRWQGALDTLSRE